MNTRHQAALALSAATLLTLGAQRAQAAQPAVALPAQAPAPLGVYGVDMPAPGKLSLSFLPSFTRMRGSRIGTDSVSAQSIIANVPSPYTPVGAHLLRMVPRDLSVNIQAFAVAYGVTKDIALTASTAVVEKSVNMQAFKGLSGSTPLGYKVGTTSGLGDTTIGAVGRVYRDRIFQVNVNFGLSLPTGSVTDNIALLLPNNTAPEKRGFYAMQPGSGTVDAMPGIAYSGVLGSWSWGAAYRARLPLDSNLHGWRYGDLHELNAWGGYSWLPGLETTLRLNGTTQGAIHGHDPGITGYAQGANPAFYGGRQISVFAGVIVGGRCFGASAATFGVEAGAPLYQDLNGPQLGRDWQVNVALRYKLL